MIEPRWYEIVIRIETYRKRAKMYGSKLFSQSLTTTQLEAQSTTCTPILSYTHAMGSALQSTQLSASLQGSSSRKRKQFLPGCSEARVPCHEPSIVEN